MDIKSVIGIALIAFMFIFLVISYSAKAIKQKEKKAKRGEMLFDEHSTIRELIDEHPEIEQVLASHGLHCAGCASAKGEELWLACQIHGVDYEDVLKDVNSKIKEGV